MLYSKLEDYQTFVHRAELIGYIGILIRCPLLSPVAHIAAVLVASISLLITICAMVNFVAHHAVNITSAVAVIAPVCTFVTTLLKIACFAIKQKKMKEVDDIVKALFTIDLKHDSRRSVLLSLLPVFYKLCSFYFILFVLVAFFYKIPPLLSIAYQYVRNIHPKRHRLAVPVKFPWDIGENGLLFHLHFLFHFLSTMPLYGVNAAAEILFGFYMFHMAGAFRMMTHRLENPEKGESRILLLHSCVKKHKLLLHCYDNLQNIYGPIILSIVLTNCIAMCTLIFQALQMQRTLKTICIQVSFFFLKFAQLYVYTWSGTVMTTESENFANGVYFSDWTDTSKKLKNDMMITMIQKPLMLSASGYFSVTMALIPKLANTTLSYYFMLKTFSENEKE